MEVRFGKRLLAYPSDSLGELRDANDVLGDVEAVRQRMDEEGFLLLRGLIDRAAVLAARKVILEHMAEQEALVPGEPVLEGVMPPHGKSVPMMGRRPITHHPAIQRVLEAPELFAFFEDYFGEKTLTFDYKWLRAVGHEGYTGAHYDVVYMGNGSPRLHTTWIPFGDIPIEQGVLAMCPRTHREPSYQKLRDTYGRMDVDRDRVDGWFSRDPLEITEQFGGQWQTTRYRAGDVMIFGMHLMHASTTNVTDRYRLSCDVRFQPASDPVDERWVGREPPGHRPAPEKANTPIKPMEVARAEWGV